MKWVKIRGFNRYSISEYGDVRNDETGRDLTKKIDKDGYIKYGLNKNGKQCYFFAHRLVAKHFLDKIEGKKIVNHLDENKQNNHFSNLEWCTVKENNNYGTRTERSAKTQAKEMAQYDLQGNLLNVFYGLNEAERKTNVRHGDISRCCNLKRKTAGGFIWKYTNK